MTDYEKRKLRDYAYSLTEAEKQIVLDALMETEIDLKPCPLCGGLAKFSHVAAPQVVCSDCGLATRAYKENEYKVMVPAFSSSAQAAEAWNKRV